MGMMKFRPYHDDQQLLIKTLPECDHIQHIDSCGSNNDSCEISDDLRFRDHTSDEGYFKKTSRFDEENSDEERTAWSTMEEERKKDEAFRKNPYVCEQAVDHYYYLGPRAKRTKRFPVATTPELAPEKDSVELHVSNKRKRIETSDDGVEERDVHKRVKNETLLDEKQSKREERKERRKKIEQVLVPKEPPSLPDELRQKIERMGVQVSEVSLVIQKVLYDTDLSYKHMRMSIPVNQVSNKDFLTPQQKMELEKRDECNKKLKIQFNLIEPSLEESKIHMAKWDMNRSSNYVLLNDWMAVVERNQLKTGMVVQLWSFCHDLVPWLALVLVNSNCST